jgi:NHS family xanthosine MFS transporter
MNFLQFFVWGAWLITIANYWFGTKQWGPVEFSAIFTTLGLSSLIMPALTGIIADKWVNAERLYGVLHILSGAVVFYLPQVNDPNTFFWFMLVAMLFYMPTIALSNSVAYNTLKSNNYDVIKVFPPIRVWGTIGFIVAMWTTNLTGSKSSEVQFYISAIGSIILGLYSFTLPACKPNRNQESKGIVESLGLNAFKLFKNPKMAMFFVFAMFLGAALQLTNMYGDVFLDEFKKYQEYSNLFVVKYSTIIMSISQVSETLFILAIPFFLKKFGIKKVMLISMFAWVLRFGLLAYGNPADGLWMIIVSCIVYGMAFDFFNVSGSLYVETQTDSKIRSSAQGLFIMMVNGIGAIIGSFTSGLIIKHFFTLKFDNINNLARHFHCSTEASWLKEITKYNKVDGNGVFNKVVEIKEWQGVWLSFALYAAVIAILFAIFFKHKHDPNVELDVKH